MEKFMAKEEVKAKRLGFNDQGKAYKGVDPKTGERVSVVLSELKHEFGAKRGEDMYFRISDVLFPNPRIRTSGESYTPDLGLRGISEEKAAEIQKILGEKE
jgi:hypothetical protein